jgi:hypothetical protein
VKQLHAFMTAPELSGKEFLGESWTVHREVIARFWDGDSDLIPGDGIHDLAKSTDHAPGQAHAASGGRFGSPQIRSAPQAPTGTKRADSSALDRGSYSPTRK